MKKTLAYGLKALQFSWQANGFYSILEIVSKIYDDTLYPLTQVFLLSKVLDAFSSQINLGFQKFYWIIVAYLFASILKLALKSLVDVKSAYLQEKLGGYIDIQISKKLSELDPATFENPEFQNLIAQLEGVKGSLQMHLIRFTSLLDAAFKFVTATLVVSTTFPWFAPAILLATIPSYIAWDRFRIKTWPYYVEKRSVLTRITRYVKTLLSSDSTSKESIIYKTGPLLLSKVKKEQHKYYTNFAKENDPWMFKIFCARIFQFSAFVYTQYLNLKKVFAATLSLGQFTLIFQQSLNLVFGAEEILNQYSSISARNKYLDKLFEFFSTEKTISSPLAPLGIPDSPHPHVIKFQNVSFKYPSTERFILKNFNITINSGEKIALVGENGAGKTTIIKLLLRFYDVTAGEILINGINIKEIDLDEWHANIGALFQDFIKYQFSFKENVYFGDLTNTNNEKYLKTAIEKSGANTYLKSLPDNINQRLGKMFEGGIDLSGGQWQKLALARAFFRDAPILILDEPTSAIDAKAEYEIFQKVQALQKDKTVIIISHRFSTVRHADRILVLSNGKIVEEGAHKNLMSQKGIYAELFELQAQGYK
jgi:ATP-binding cassette subfamily B protein